MARYIFKRTLQAIPMLIFISILSFLLIKMAPGDPVRSYVTPNMSAEDVERVRVNLGLDKPVPMQYVAWLKNVLKGDFGYSLINYRPVSHQIKERIPATLLLMGTSLITAIIFGIIFGLIAAYNKNKWIDNIISIISYIGISIPSFWFAMILIVIFSQKLRLLPSVGMHTIGINSTLDVIKHTIMPATVLSFQNFAVITRYIRSKAITEMKEDYVRTAIGKGVSSRKVFGTHILKNTLLPIITIIGMSLPNLIAGAFITETIFGWPGMGRLGINAIFSFDYPLIMAITMISALMLILGNLIADILYGVVDPRIKAVN
ncbi:ABC transporter permease [Clostridium algidicarnis]|uniref:ABC transporter permease n=1 Tax=Clostridium algidicarnis TaxID=37659 RepID=UPI00162A9CF6|nr:ABC transporter permease [Clostridium algidicarnis]MBB6632307.1 ABC transporter permease [Clostridium algidicarnis]MBU3204915.1 ABC transporter permease [Clostridium algidicarnis]MBU3207681.1 ABC transporter permease [Clostridium algidicarnis]MBU3213069.1 ABC transporter permease [Clostridium algidicarnis]MBU3223725.1 ABC transporter permease [Clostridium algidicarnis]